MQRQTRRLAHPQERFPGGAEGDAHADLLYRVPAPLVVPPAPFASNSRLCVASCDAIAPHCEQTPTKPRRMTDYDYWLWRLCAIASVQRARITQHGLSRSDNGHAGVARRSMDAAKETDHLSPQLAIGGQEALVGASHHVDWAAYVVIPPRTTASSHMHGSRVLSSSAPICIDSLWTFLRPLGPILPWHPSYGSFDLPRTYRCLTRWHVSARESWAYVLRH
jgi:hypothetical protein